MAYSVSKSANGYAVPQTAFLTPMNDIFDIAELPWLRVKRNHHLWQRRQRLNAMQKELSRLRRENAAMLEILRSVLDESRWSELDQLLEPQMLTTSVH